MEPFRLPEKIEDLSPKWFSQILGIRIRPESLKLIGNVNEGLGFLSSLVRAEFELENGAKQALIVKLIPTDEFCRTALLEDNLDKTEILSYEALLPQFIKEVPELGKYICEVLYAKIQSADPVQGIPYNSVLVLKDLKPEGYYVVTTNKDLREGHYRQGLDFLVKLHGASACLEKRLGASIPSIYADWFTNGYETIPPGEDVVFPKLYLFFPKGIPVVNPLLEKHPRLNSQVRPAMNKIAANSRGIFRAAINAGQAHPTLVHGDLWTLNMLVKDGDFPIKVIDWQLVGYTDPAFDLAIFLTFCLPLSLLTPEGVTQALKEYYDGTEKLMKIRGLEVKRSWEEFYKFFSTWGLTFLFTVLMGSPPLQTEESSLPKLYKIFELLLDMKVFDFMLSIK